MPSQRHLYPSDTLYMPIKSGVRDSGELIVQTEKEEGNQFEFLEILQRMHQELDVPFDSLHTIDFTRLLRKFDN